METVSACWQGRIKLGSEICFLITILYNNELLRCALKVQRDKLPGDCSEHPMEPENRAVLHAMLPDHVKYSGPIVDIESIFEVHCV